MKLIDKDRAIAEIEKVIADENESIKTFEHGRNISEVQRSNARIDVLTYIKSLLDTLEVKEVDLEKLLSDLDKDIKEFVGTEEFERESITAGHYWVIAKHAFLLGLKAQKGE